MYSTQHMLTLSQIQQEEAKNFATMQHVDSSDEIAVADPN